MNLTNKKTIISLICFGAFLLASVASCNKVAPLPSTPIGAKNSFESSGDILGFDMTMCACCGGWIIRLDGDSTDYRFDTLPAGANIDLNTATFPLPVNLNWSSNSNYCGNRMTIDAIELD